MIPVKVVSISKVFVQKTQWGEKDKVNMVVKQLDTGEEHKTSFFVGKNGVPQEGQEILADLVKSGDYVNMKKWETMGITSVPQGTPPIFTTPTPKLPTKEEKPLERDRIIVRQNALGHAVELVKDVQSFQEAKDLSKMTMEVKSVAAELETWVFRPI